MIISEKKADEFDEITNHNISVYIEQWPADNKKDLEFVLWLHRCNEDVAVSYCSKSEKYYTRVWFSNEDDALLFKLTWM